MVAFASGNHNSMIKVTAIYCAPREGRAKTIADEMAKQLKVRFQERGRIDAQPLEPEVS